MFAAYADRTEPDDPLAALQLGERPALEVPDGWARVRLRAMSLNHHDLWSLQGVGLRADRLPMILGCDGAGIDDDGNEVVVPRRNLVPKPADVTFEEAACLPTAWLTAYRMLFTRSGLGPGSTVLVQGAGGGVSTALVALGSAAGYRMWVTSRDEAKREKALELGADQAFESGARLPDRVDGVMETVGRATWSHSVKSLRPGGTIVVCGATSGDAPPAELTRVFFLQLRVIGSTMGTRDELARLLQLCAVTGVRPVIDRSMPLEQARDGFAQMLAGDVFGKIVFTR
jgi:NADPH:quinone reductase-like Zn-dependent oxidoreductase